VHHSFRRASFLSIILSFITLASTRNCRESLLCASPIAFYIKNVPKDNFLQTNQSSKRTASRNVLTLPTCRAIVQTPDAELPQPVIYKTKVESLRALSSHGAVTSKSLEFAKNYSCAFMMRDVAKCKEENGKGEFAFPSPTEDELKFHVGNRLVLIRKC
jgi:hypothetical protein